jgi:hypothetical protein
MKSFLSLSFILFACLVGFLGCKGKTGPEGIQGPTGPTGPLGPGSTQYIYTGNFPSSILANQHYTVNIPEMTIDSDFLVSTSSNAITWDFNSAFFDVNPTNKNLVFYITPFHSGYFYRIVVKNYP